MLYEMSTVDVPASIETTLHILQDVEAMNDWIEPQLPSWPRVTAQSRVVERTADGAPALVAVTSSVLGISDRSLTGYVWSDTGCRATLLQSKVLRSSRLQIELEETAAGTRLTFEGSADLKIRLPRLVERQFTKIQEDLRAALNRAIVAEARRRNAPA